MVGWFACGAVRMRVVSWFACGWLGFARVVVRMRVVCHWCSNVLLGLVSVAVMAVAVMAPSSLAKGSAKNIIEGFTA